jgi:hypothetical protein
LPGGDFDEEKVKLIMAKAEFVHNSADIGADQCYKQSRVFWFLGGSACHK